MALPHPLKFVVDESDDIQLDAPVLLVSSEEEMSMGFIRVSEYENVSRANEDMPRESI